jgi:hypothetical protein
VIRRRIADLAWRLVFRLAEFKKPPRTLTEKEKDL